MKSGAQSRTREQNTTRTPPDARLTTSKYRDRPGGILTEDRRRSMTNLVPALAGGISPHHAQMAAADITVADHHLVRIGEVRQLVRSARSGQRGRIGGDPRPHEGTLSGNETENGTAIVIVTGRGRGNVSGTEKIGTETGLVSHHREAIHTRANAHRTTAMNQAMTMRSHFGLHEARETAVCL